MREVLVLCVLFAVPSMARGDDRTLELKALKREALSARPQTKAKPPSSVVVDCARGDRIQDAVDRNESPITIDVRGLCAENVLVDQKDVTLRGTNPAVDGIRGLATNNAALQFRHSGRSSVENLGISHGAGAGVNVVFSTVFINASQVIGNALTGMTIAAASRVDALETVVSQNSRGVAVGSGAIFFCTGCRLENNRSFAGIANGGIFSFLDSVVTGRLGIAASGGGAYADIDCLSAQTSYPCSMNVTGVAAIAWERGSAAIWGASDFTGQLTADSAMVSLYGATQLAAGQPGQGPNRNHVLRFGRLIVDPAYEFDRKNSRILGTDVDQFGGLIVADVAVIAGHVQCESGGDAWFDPNTTVEPGASVSGCEHGALPATP